MIAKFVLWIPQQGVSQRRRECLFSTHFCSDFALIFCVTLIPPCSLMHLGEFYGVIEEKIDRNEEIVLGQLPMKVPVLMLLDQEIGRQTQGHGLLENKLVRSS